MSRSQTNNRIVKTYEAVMWQDSDVPVQIKDLSYAGKLAAKSNEESDKENQKILIKSCKETLTRKKRQTKKMSIAPFGADNQGQQLNLDENSSSSLSSTTAAAIGQLTKDYEQHMTIRSSEHISLYENGVMLKTLSNHFAIGNQSAIGNGPAAGAESNKTSNNKLESMRISYAEMCDRLKTYRSKYQNSIDKINDAYCVEHFDEWFNLMKAKFNVLLHGVGSKKSLIEKFCATHLNDAHYLIIYGYHHDFNIKTVFKTILTDMLGLEEKHKTTEEQINAINSNLNCELYLIIHNIDGNCLRDPSIQYCFSELATNPNIHFLASVDHINSYLLWDNTQYGQFRWIHFEINTLMPYSDEIMFENSLMLGQAGNVQLSSLIHVLKSLTQNAKNIFYIMSQHVLNPDNVKKNVLFTKLYHECREKFLVSNEMTLRAQLTEFIDHKLIKLKAEANGQEAIYLLVDDRNLKLYLEDLKDKL